jgi:anionic cell wall polymer biosynthesis LytR-Cps2A-Psr (LCP) family protein
MGKSILVGVLVALVVAAVVVGGGYYYLSTTAKVSGSGDTSRVVLVFVSPDQDGAMVARLVSLVSDGRLQDISPETTVTIPGTDASRLSDAYAFGGGAGVASAIATGAATAYPYVVVTPQVWRDAVDRSQGVTVTLSENVDVFDGATLTTLPPGDQRLNSQQVQALMSALPFVRADLAPSLREQLVRQLSAALVSGGIQPAQLETDLSAEAVKAWLNNALLKAVTR